MKNRFIFTFILVSLALGCTKDADFEDQEINQIQVTDSEESANSTTNLEAPEENIDLDKQLKKTQQDIHETSIGGGSTIGGFGDPDQGCGEITFPIYDPVIDGPHFRLLDVYYNSNVVSINEINCIREEFFEDFPYLRIQEGYLNNSTPFHDVWLVPSFTNGGGPPFSVEGRKDSVKDKVRNDPRTEL